jgi:hypothetical protein
MKVKENFVIGAEAKELTSALAHTGSISAILASEKKEARP